MGLIEGYCSPCLSGAADGAGIGQGFHGHYGPGPCSGIYGYCSALYPAFIACTALDAIRTPLALARSRHSIFSMF